MSGSFLGSFLRKQESRFALLAVFLAALASPASALACAVCYGAADGPFIRGLQLSVIALLGVTYFVIGGLLAFFILKRRAGFHKLALPHPSSPYKGEEKRAGLPLIGEAPISLPLLCKEGHGEVESCGKLQGAY